MLIILTEKKERTTLEELLEFLNKSSIEPNLAWTLPHLYEKEREFEVQWIYNALSSANYYFREKGESAWKTVIGKDLISLMKSEKVDLTYFEFQLLKIICIQAVCSHYYIERAGDLIGKDKITEAINLITGFTEEKKSSKKSKKSKIPRLKLVRRKKRRDDKI